MIGAVGHAAGPGARQRGGQLVQLRHPECRDASHLKAMQDHADPGISARSGRYPVGRYRLVPPATMYNSSACVQGAATWTRQTSGSTWPSRRTARDPDRLRGTRYGHREGPQRSGAGTSPSSTTPSAKSSPPPRVGGSGAPAHSGLGNMEVQDALGGLAQSYTTTQANNIRNKRANFTTSRADRSPRRERPPTALPFIDIVRFRDWLRVRLPREPIPPARGCGQDQLRRHRDHRVLGRHSRRPEEARSNGAITRTSPSRCRKPRRSTPSTRRTAS